MRRTFTERNTKGTTLDDLRRHQHEKSKQHKWRDKESDTKIDHDTRRVVRRRTRKHEVLARVRIVSV